MFGKLNTIRVGVNADVLSAESCVWHQAYEWKVLPLLVRQGWYGMLGSENLSSDKTSQIWQSFLGMTKLKSFAPKCIMTVLTLVLKHSGITQKEYIMINTYIASMMSKHTQSNVGYQCWIVCVWKDSHCSWFFLDSFGFDTVLSPKKEEILVRSQFCFLGIYGKPKVLVLFVAILWH